MLRFVVLASLLFAPACRILLQDTEQPVQVDAAPGGRACKVSTTVQVCLDAASHSDLTWIQTNIFNKNCGTDSCHGATSSGMPPKGKILLDTAADSVASMVNVPSMIGKDPQRMIVVPGNAKASYLLLISRQLAPADADPPGVAPPTDPGFMPQRNGVLCCQKLDAMERWITAGAHND